MSLDTLQVDVYQLTTLLAHADAGRLHHAEEMAVFFRRLPTQRNYVVFCGLRSILEHAAGMRFSHDELETLRHHPTVGPALKARPAVERALQELDGFVGEIDSLPEGTLAFAGPGRRTDGRALEVAGAPLQLYTPLMQVRTDLVRAKLLETPWLSRINHQAMVASKAARVVTAARDKTVLEFGSRRTHPLASIDASYAAYIGGCVSTSNFAALHKWGIPATGTMDHFYVQAAEQEGRSPSDTEREAFATFAQAFPDAAILLIDTYDTERGIANAVAATNGKLAGIRIDSNVNPTTVARARQQLAELGAPHAKIFVSDGLDEVKVTELRDLVDGFGVGERITTSPDAATGVGAVAKLIVHGYGKITMKVAKGSGKATLPGRLQVWRYRDHDLIALADEGTPAGGHELLRPVWRQRAASPLPTASESRQFVRDQIAGLPPSLRELDVSKTPWPLVASDGLVERIESLVEAAGVSS